MCKIPNIWYTTVLEQKYFLYDYKKYLYKCIHYVEFYLFI